MLSTALKIALAGLACFLASIAWLTVKFHFEAEKPQQGVLLPQQTSSLDGGFVNSVVWRNVELREAHNGISVIMPGAVSPRKLLKREVQDARFHSRAEYSSDLGRKHN